MRATGPALAKGAVALALVVGPLVVASARASAGAPRYKPYKCVVKDANDCVVTIALTSHLDEQVGSTMPDRARPWYLHVAGGAHGKGGYTLSGPGAPQTYWDGKSGATRGHVWSARLQTGTVRPGDDAVLTFSHVKPSARHYAWSSYTYTSRASTGAVVAVTAQVSPTPPAGHVLVQRLDASRWTNVVRLAYSSATKRWRGSFRWPYPAHTTKTFRLLATAAPGLLATPSPSFRIATGA